MKKILLTLLTAGVTLSCSTEGKSKPENVVISAVRINETGVADNGTVTGVDPGSVSVHVTFSAKIDFSKFEKTSFRFDNGIGTAYSAVREADGCSIVLTLNAPLKPFTQYTFSVSRGENLGVKIVLPFSCRFLTALDGGLKFPEISDTELMDLVQRKTFGYFWDYAHPVSGLARERLGSGNTVTSGGSGFGIMTIPVGIERGFISRTEGSARMKKIVDFLLSKADRFHGAFPHWLDGGTGQALPFSSNDNGADLVETALLMQGLLAARQYFDGTDPVESELRARITTLWQDVEWDWFLRGTTRLYWHWSPDKGWAMNMPVTGWNEALIVYVLAASSPTHSVSREVYDKGWAGSGRIKNGKSFYGIPLPLGPDYGGPLFFSHYSFLGLDPRNLKDAYSSYWEQNVAHARINHAYCKANPKGFYGYGQACWGLTASDFPKGYTASSPTNDNGTIAPTAALSSFPYTPEESLAALRHFYYKLGDRLFREYGFIDAFNLSRNWFASSYIAIDQGPIVIMLENFRTGLLWDTFMKDKDIRSGLEKLGFTW